MQMRRDVAVDVPADQAWELVGTKFGEIATWAAPILTSELDADGPVPGVARVCRFVDFGPIPGGTLTERLIAFDPITRSLAYRAESGMPGFVVDAVNRWSVHELAPDRCVVRIHATLALTWWARPLGPLLRWRIRRGADGVAADLAHRLERGVARAGAPVPPNVR